MTEQTLPILMPLAAATETFTDPAAAVARLEALYFQATEFLSRHFSEAVTGGKPAARVRAFYPEIRLTTTSFAKTDSRLSFGHVAQPGTYATTVTRPDLFRSYLIQQIGLLVHNHGVTVSIGASETPIPVHFAVAGNPAVAVPQEGVLEFSLRDVFDVPDLTTTNDDIVNGVRLINPDGSAPLAPFTAQRVDYSLARLTHYTATEPSHFQNHVLFTNYQFYVDEFEAFAREALADKSSGYTSFVSPGNHEITEADEPLPLTVKMPQMPTYHLKREDGQGIT
ncbi:MAG TPA: AMP nucleosidase, partial [Paracoccaceae bacterium]